MNQLKIFFIIFSQNLQKLKLSNQLMWIQLLFGFLILITVVIYFFYWKPKTQITKFAKNAEQLGYIVKVMPFKFMGYYMLQYLQKDEKSLKDFKQEFHKYDLIVGNIFNKLSFFAIKPILLKDVLNQMNKLPKNPFVSQAFQILNGGGIVFTEGQVWKRKRRIISSVFHFEFLNSLIPTMQELVSEKFKQIDQKISQGKQVNLLDNAVNILSSVVAKGFFGTDMRQYLIQGQPFCNYFVHFMNQIALYINSMEYKLFRTKPFKLQITQKSRKLKKDLDIVVSIAKEITLKQVQKIKNGQQKSKNILTALYENNMLNFSSQKQNPEQYSIEELIGQFMIFFAAGTDTTSNAINLMLHYLSSYPQYVQKIRNQSLDLQKDSTLAKAQKLKKMKFLDAFFNETLRIGAPSVAFFPRIATQDIMIGGLKVSKGSSISAFPLVNHYNPQYFQNPYQFNPERWNQQKKIENYTYLPFGGGQRNCLGQYLARIQAKLLVEKICSRYDFKAKYPIKMQAKFVYATNHGQFDMKIRDNQKK